MSKVFSTLRSNYLVFIALLVVVKIEDMLAQINLGTFGLKKNPRGELELGFGQGGSLFGFGGDRSLQATIGPGVFGTKTGNGVMLGGERVGVDSHLGLQQGQGLNLGSFLKLGDQPINPLDSMGPLSALLNNLGGIFQPRRPIVQPPPRPSAPAPVVEPLLVTSRRPEFTAVNVGTDQQFPPAVGKGWDGVEGEEDYEQVGRPPSAPEPNVPVKSGGGITTEGKRRSGVEKIGPVAGGKLDGKHDGGTGELSSIMGKLPIPEGLEMIDGNKALKH